MRTHRPAVVVAASFLLLSGAAVAAPPAHAVPSAGLRAGDRATDFDGDGYEDVLIGAPGGTAGGRTGAGYVTVQYGGPDGVGTVRGAVLDQNTAGVPGAAETGDGFGRALATGDLDSDGYADAVVGVPGEDIEPLGDAGGVVVLWGSPTGLSGTGSAWLQAPAPAAGAAFGSALAAARFSPDIPGDQLAVIDRTDLTQFQYDERTRKAPATRTGRVPGTPGHEIAPRSLTTGDYDDNGLADLVVSGLTTGTEPGHGRSAVLLGEVQGLRFDHDLRGGPAVASGDIDHDGYDDLVTGEPYSPDDGGATTTGGVVGVYHGSAGDGPVGAGGPGTPPVWWTQDTPGVPGGAEAGDGWGADLSVADTDGDGFADVAIGAPGEDIGTVADAGAVWLLRGSAQGLTATGAASWDQDAPGIPGAAERGDRWGGQVRLSDDDGDARAALLAAAPGENAGDGIVWILPAGPGGVTATGSRTFDAGTFGGVEKSAGYGGAIDE
ncbi:FG-GAP repeat protein [Streptomyces sp. NPDC059783]|uniref:FG-GAP repeat protein n=1 Tax=Streptomyces sp. NPDC059783 TaxID=3346944 RepID=UPI00365D385C